MLYIRLSILLICSALCSSGCSHDENQRIAPQSGAEPVIKTLSHLDDGPVVLAVNVGGPAHTGIDGVEYQADEGHFSGELRTMTGIRGTQDPVPFETYRTGKIKAALNVPNGNYSVILKFAEPEDISIAARLFDIELEGQRRIVGLDVLRGRDNNSRSALVRALGNVHVSDGTLDIALIGQKLSPVLSAIVIHRKSRETTSWNMVWQDEFGTSGPPNPDFWTVDEWPARKVNGEDQAYTARSKNIRIENGHLVIEAHQEKLKNAEYTSGRLHTMGKIDFLYGRAVIRAKLAAGQGTWSALWMLPSDPYRYATTCTPGEDWQGSLTCDAWPNSGEIDIMEHVGYDMGTVHATVHTRAYYFINQKQRKAAFNADNVAAVYHEYAIEWSPERIDVFLDGNRYFSYMNEGSGWQSWPFDHPYHLVFNLAVGGDWGRAGGPIDNSMFPARMEIDYVRLYQRSPD